MPLLVSVDLVKISATYLPEQMSCSLVCWYEQMSDWFIYWWLTALETEYFVFVLFFYRYDKEGHAMDGQSMTELRGPGGGGGNTNWKTLAEVKNEHLGHGDKVCWTNIKCWHSMRLLLVLFIFLFFCLWREYIRTYQNSQKKKRTFYFLNLIYLHNIYLKFRLYLHV